MVDRPRSYDRTYTAPVGGHAVRRRLGIDLDRGTVTRFVVQLEYLVDPIHEGWQTVVRYDHDSEGSDVATHDVTTDGLHVDVYRDGEKVESRVVSGPLPANDALERAEEHLTTHMKQFIRRFERWHGINETGR